MSSVICCYKYTRRERENLFEKESRELFLLALSFIVEISRGKMGRYLTKRMFLLLLLLISSSSSYGAPVNSNKEGRFPPFESEGKLVDLINVCKVFNGKACCSASRMLSVSKAVENLATYGEADKDCLQCSICHSGTLHICDRVFEACSEAYFSTSDDATNQVIVPCGASQSIIICGKASKWETNGTDFCYALGFTVQSAVDSAEEPCFGSNSSLEVKEALIKTKHSTWFQPLQISWLITVLVLRTMLIKRWRYQQQMRAMLQRMREER